MSSKFYLISNSVLDSITNENKCFFFVIQGRQHRFLPEQPCRQPLKWVLGTSRNWMSFCFLYASLKSIIQKSAVPNSALLLECHGKKLFNNKNIIYRNLWYCLYIPPKDSARFYQTGVLLARNFRTSCQPRISRF